MSTPRRAVELPAASADQGVFSGESPVGPAAAAPYVGAMLVGEGLTQREAGDLADISEVTIRNR